MDYFKQNHLFKSLSNCRDCQVILTFKEKVCDRHTVDYFEHKVEQRLADKLWHRIRGLSVCYWWGTFHDRDQEFSSTGIGEVSGRMIFKSCAWPSEMKEENHAVVGEISASGATERKIANVVLRCCPCIFRCRKSVGVDRDHDEEDGENASISTIITTATTPVIALRLSRNSDTVYVFTDYRGLHGLINSSAI